ncbi:hypothetical protein F2P81_015586 [Scophthalmus maximus]|uniref:Uncharacterized protein n=1 Tax=Scophthalmus maximus TaxID=52904 RepID=A0A6A4SDT0_SCOMX|nr:hypothetical protein F2P81_015586 [Scophthalmus maximus]
MKKFRRGKNGKLLFFPSFAEHESYSQRYYNSPLDVRRFGQCWKVTDSKRFTCTGNRRARRRLLGFSEVPVRGGQTVDLSSSVWSRLSTRASAAAPSCRRHVCGCERKRGQSFRILDWNEDAARCKEARIGARPRSAVGRS